MSAVPTGWDALPVIAAAAAHSAGQFALCAGIGFTLTAATITAVGYATGGRR
jgi:hypothetical protein